MSEDYASCSRCRRPAPPQLNGPPDAPGDDFAAWEIFGGEGDDPEEDDVLVCPRCLTGEDEAAIAAAFDEYDPLVQIPLLVADFEAGRITGSDFEDRLAEQGLFVEAMGPEDPEIGEATRLLKEACAKLPPESIGDLLAKVYRQLDRLPPELRGEDSE